jgi:hypothetical protein
VDNFLEIPRSCTTGRRARWQGPVHRLHFSFFLPLQRFWCGLRVAVTQTVLFPSSGQPAAILNSWGFRKK